MGSCWREGIGDAKNGEGAVTLWYELSLYVAREYRRSSYRQHKRPISPWHWKPSETTTQQLSIAPEAQRKPLSLAIPQPHHSIQPVKIDRSLGRYHCPRGLGDPPFIHRIRNFNLDLSASMDKNIQLSTIHQKRRHLKSHLFHLSSRTTTTRARARDFGTVGTHFVGSYSSVHAIARPCGVLLPCLCTVALDLELKRLFFAPPSDRGLFLENTSRAPSKCETRASDDAHGLELVCTLPG